MPYFSIDENGIKHFGIKGMKWGVRRYQNEDGSLTPAGRARYGVKEAREKVRNAPTFKERQQAQKELLEANNNFRTEKILESEEKRSSKKYNEYTKEYKEKGYSDNEAKKAAAKRAHAERTLKIIGGVAVGALAVKFGKSYMNKNFDRVIRAGKNLQRVTREGEPIRDAFYASYKMGDNQKYRGLLGNQLREVRNSFYNRAIGTSQSPEVVKRMTLGRDVRIASERSARNALQELINTNPEYKKYFETMADLPINRIRNQAALKRGKITTNMYRSFNRGLVAEGQTAGGPGKKMVDDFYKKLKDAGYDAIQDANDKFTSGYRSSDPIIVFNRDVVSSTVDKALSDSQIDLERNIATGRLYLEAILPGLAVGAGINEVALAKQDLNDVKKKG